MFKHKQILSIPRNSVVEIADCVGALGWELVSVVEHDRYVDLYFKREYSQLELQQPVVDEDCCCDAAVMH